MSSVQPGLSTESQGIAISNLSWRDSYSGRITKYAFEQRVQGLAELEKRLEEISQAAYSTADLVLGEIYDEILGKIAAKLGILSLVCPDAIAHLIPEMEAEVARLEKQVEEELETGLGEVARNKFDEVIEKLGRYSTLLRVLKSVHHKGQNRG